MRELCTDFENAIDPDTGEADPEIRSNLARTIVQLSGEIRKAELHEQALRPEAKTPEEHEMRIRVHFEALPKPRQVEVAKALVQVAGDGTLLGR